MNGNGLEWMNLIHMIFIYTIVVKKEMARMNTDILGISELRWTGMGEFNSDDHCIYYCEQGSLRRNGVALIVSKESEMQ